MSYVIVFVFMLPFGINTNSLLNGISLIAYKVMPTAESPRGTSTTTTGTVEGLDTVILKEAPLVITFSNIYV